MEKRFYVGCNYWALNAGAEMWRRFDIECIRKDMTAMKEAGIDTIRVFPTWNDFQPIFPVFTQDGALRNVTAREGATIDGNGLDPIMLERFSLMLDAAEKEGIEIIVGLITGWMSGKLFIPEALYFKNVIKDPDALMWQSRFVTGFVNKFKDRRIIIAWDLGNEGNCMAAINNSSEGYLWTATISGAIKREDQSRPVISGMHSLDADPSGKWTIKVQGELTDILTTHPYDYWVPYCLSDSIASMRAVMHSAAESRLYSSLGGKPCLVEEIGTMGPMICNDETARGYMRATLYNNWAEGFMGQLWWCAFDQNKLDFPPYDVMGCERELGLFTAERKLKPFGEEIAAFKKQLKDAGLISLPAPRKNALIILTYDSETWPIALGAYILGKQAGLEPDYAYCDKEVGDYPLYILPSIKGNRVLPKARWQELINKVKAGATLLITMDDCFLQPFESVTGIRVKNFYSRDIKGKFNMNGDIISYEHDRLYDMENISAEELASNDCGVFYRNSFGKGKVYTLTFPLEKYIAKKPGIVSSPKEAHYMIYSAVAQGVIESLYNKKDKLLSVTEHILSEKEAYIQFINCDSNTLELPLEFNGGYSLDKIIKGAVTDGKLTLSAFETAMIKITK